MIGMMLTSSSGRSRGQLDITCPPVTCHDRDAVPSLLRDGHRAGHSNIAVIETPASARRYPARKAARQRLPFAPILPVSSLASIGFSSLVA